eukprot:CAMPEP_0114536254 /NCGR_PEP_ID=MMETSP0109-20121206/28888_1 /TAXON_ID=29199 /ORGANISM="Chlorarachnion reptans, Strain CCCM449" /LENGTH=477 /DNA_ID=CAMNT_0001719947 /DNA_START=1 /DNA_END=1430 /DNA_ORIENTATION=+
MGAGVPSREVGGEAEAAAEQDHADDVEVLAETCGIGDLDMAYARLLTFGLLNRNDSYLRKKRDAQQRKHADSEVVLQTSLSDEPGESQFRRRKLKCLQREMSFLSRPAEPFMDHMAGREQVLCRIALAFRRTMSHEKKHGKWYGATLEDKVKFIKGWPVPVPRSSDLEKAKSKDTKDGNEAKGDTKDSSETTTAASTAEPEGRILVGAGTQSSAPSEAKNEAEKSEVKANPNPGNGSVAESSSEKKEEKSEEKKGKKAKENKESKREKRLKKSAYSMDQKFIDVAISLAETMPELYGATGLTSLPHQNQTEAWAAASGTGLSGADAQRYISMLRQRLDLQALQNNPERLLRFHERLQSVGRAVRGRSGRSAGGNIEVATRELLTSLMAARSSADAEIRDIDALEEILGSHENIPVNFVSRGEGSASRGSSRGGSLGSGPAAAYLQTQLHQLRQAHVSGLTAAVAHASETRAADRNTT